MSDIMADIRTLLADGTPLADIVVNDGDDRWGETCATTRAEQDALMADWRDDHNEDDQGEIEPLPSAIDWLARTGNTL